MSQKQKLWNSLRKGKVVTIAFAEGVLGVPASNVHKRIYDLRQAGAKITTGKKVMKSGPRRGQRVTTYTLSEDQHAGKRNSFEI